MIRLLKHPTTLLILIIMAIAAGSITLMLLSGKTTIICSEESVDTAISDITSSLYFARMKAVHNGIDHAVLFGPDGSFSVVRDPAGEAVVLGDTHRLKGNMELTLSGFRDQRIIFGRQGSLSPDCLTDATDRGSILLTGCCPDTVIIDIAGMSGEITSSRL